MPAGLGAGNVQLRAVCDNVHSSEQALLLCTCVGMSTHKYNITRKCYSVGRVSKSST